MKPYKDTFLNRNTRIRRFKQSVSSEELVWHRDRSDRVVKIVEGSGWQLQMDNGLPEKLVAGKEYHIPANNYHRLIKGKTDLVAEIKEDKMKITRRQLRRIIKESIIDVASRITKDIRGAKTISREVSPDRGPNEEGYYEDITIEFPFGLYATFEHSVTMMDDEFGNPAPEPSYSYTFWNHNPAEGGNAYEESEGIFGNFDEIYPIFIDHARELMQIFQDDPTIAGSLEY